MVGREDSAIDGGLDFIQNFSDKQHQEVSGGTESTAADISIGRWTNTWNTMRMLLQQ